MKTAPENLGKIVAGTNSLEITVRGKEEDIRKAMDMVENIEEMIYHESLTEGACDFTVKIAGDQDMRENIFFALAEAKYPLLKMQPTNMTLEDVFLPDNITSVGMWGFRGCTSLKSVRLSQNLSQIADYGFSECSSLDNVVFPASFG